MTNIIVVLVVHATSIRVSYETPRRWDRREYVGQGIEVWIRGKIGKRRAAVLNIVNIVAQEHNVPLSTINYQHEHNWKPKKVDKNQLSLWGDDHES